MAILTILMAGRLDGDLLDLRSIRVVSYQGAAPVSVLPHEETLSTLVEDGENPQIGWQPSGVYWTVNDGSAQADTSRASMGSGSVMARVTNLPGGYGYPGWSFMWRTAIR